MPKMNVAVATEDEKAIRPAIEILWLKDFLFYRFPVIASHMLRETGHICAAQRPTLTTAQWRIISILANYPALMATEISRISMLDEVAVSRSLAILTRRGIIQRKRNRQDKRAREVSLTLSGWRYYSTVMPLMKEQNDVLRSLFAEGELVALYGAMDRIDEAFEALISRRRTYGKNLDLADIIKKRISDNVIDARSKARRKNDLGGSRK